MGRFSEQLWGDSPERDHLATGNLFFATGLGRNLNPVGGTVGVGLSYNSQSRAGYGLRGSYGVDANGNGLLDPSETQLARLDPLVSFNWLDRSPGQSVAADNFAAAWDGFIRVPQLSNGVGLHTWTFAGGHDDKMSIMLERVSRDTWARWPNTKVRTGPIRCRAHSIKPTSSIGSYPDDGIQPSHDAKTKITTIDQKNSGTAMPRKVVTEIT